MRHTQTIASKLSRLRRRLVRAWSNGFRFHSDASNRYGHPLLTITYAPAGRHGLFFAINEGAYPNFAIRFKGFARPVFLYLAVRIFKKPFRIIWDTNYARKKAFLPNCYRVGDSN